MNSAKIISPKSSPSAIKKEYKFSKETGLILGCAMRVHSELGN